MRNGSSRSSVLLEGEPIIDEPLSSAPHYLKYRFYYLLFKALVQLLNAALLKIFSTAATPGARLNLPDYYKFITDWELNINT